MRTLRVVVAAFMTAALMLIVGCGQKSETTVVEDESGTFEEIGEGIDKTKEAAEETAEEAEKTADKIEDATDGN